MRHFAAILALSFAFLFLFGCSQKSIPAACAGVEATRLANCVYNNAVMEQNPYFCYAIDDKEQRAICMRDAADQNMKKTLQSALASQREAIFTEQPSVPEKESTQPSGSPQAPPQEQPNNCASLIGTVRDECFSAIALDSKVIARCEPINDATIRKSCISEIARQTKDIESCKTLTQADNINLCNLYVKGDESKG